MGNTHGTSGNGPIISVEDARAHICDEEYRRLKAAFSGFKKQFITYDEFCYHVLGGARIPEDMRRELFLFCSRNSETLSFENLLTALVGLCRIEQVQEHFIEECKGFASWGLRPPLLTIPMSDSYISFYEVMSYVTHLSVGEVMELEKVFATISDRSVCKLSKDRWDAALCDCFPRKFSDQLFRVFDENGDNQIDFRELVCGLSAMCRGPFPSRLSFLAKLWDEDCDAMLSDAELKEMYTDLNVPEGDRVVAKSSGEKAAVVDFATWANENEYSKEYYAMAMEIGHICLGLRPESYRVGFALVKWLKIDLPTCPDLYLLIKTHKLVSSDDLVSTDPSLFKVRPIISCVDGPTDRITWLITLVLTQLLKYIPAHLTNTQMFLDRLRNAQPNNAYVMESFDVTALYTNVSNDSAMQAIRELLIQHEGAINMYGFSIQQLMTLLKECLNCSIFRWSGRYYAQMRGLAMGQRLAPSLAIAYMSKVEAPVIDLGPSFEYRSKGLPLPEWNIVSSVWHNAWSRAASEGKPPPPVDNSSIKGAKADDGWSGKVACLSLESANLRVDLNPEDYIAVPPVLWRAWLRWHGSAQSVDGQFTRKRLGGEFFPDGKEALELYPMDILLLGHDKKKTKDIDGIQQLSPWACAQVSRSCTVDELLQLCRNELRLGDGDARLWLVGDEGNTLLDDGKRTLHQLTVKGKRVNKFLLELRDSNGVWPEELRASLTGTQISSLACTIEFYVVFCYGQTKIIQTTGRPGAVGLVNSGNFCYRNAAIQCLARVSPLTEYLLNEAILNALKRGDANNNASFATTLEYSKLLREMWSTKNKNISPNGFNEAVRFAEQFDDGEQHDCQEFVSFLIERFHTCVAKMENQNSIIDGERSHESKESGNNEASCGKDEANDADETDEEKAEKVKFGGTGQLRSRLICRKCKSASSVFEVFTSLSLPIGFENVELYQITVVRRDGSVPRRYGFRLPRECTVSTFKGLVAEASGVSRDALTVQCLSKRGCFMNPSNAEADIALSSVPSGARLYALQLPEDTPDWRVAIHRKLQYNYEPYFLGATGGFIVTQFGLPLIVPCPPDFTGKQLYEDVMVQMRRFMDTSSPTTSSRAHDPSEDISFGYPFSLCLADESWEWCGQCPPLRFCRGCLIKPDSSLANIPKNCGIAVDWLPIALYLKYNHSQELACEDDESVAETWSRHFAPSSLEHCLERFSCPETLDALIHCDKCNEKTKRDKVMTIWRLPRYLIIHLKRFEFLRYEKRMGKCKRVITFPLKQFDPASFVDGKGERSKYECIAIANHYGQLSSGHFVAYARGSGEKWLLLNDCSVKVSETLKIVKAFIIACKVCAYLIVHCDVVISVVYLF
uniref:ubiquitinyl hydrolase 1 n=1 Tax=Angiostrongylus cantonensis TaxID=6313 RepID=A0A0K0DGD5_ANGCA